MASCMDKIKLKLKETWDYVQTDQFSLEVFIGQIFFLFFIAVYVTQSGSPARVSRGYDPDHQACGVDLGYEDFPYIYFVTPDSDHLYRTFCVSKCPIIKNLPDDTTLIDCRPNSIVPSCSQNPSIFNASKQVAYYDTFLFKDNVCVPSNLQYYNQLKTALLPSGQHSLVHDVYHTELEVIIFGSILALILTLILMQLIDDYYQQVMWTFLIGTILGIAFAGILFFQQAIKSYTINQTPKPAVTSFQVTEEYILQTANNGSVGTNLVLGFLFVFLLLISTYELYKKFSQVKLLLMILKLTDKFMEDSQNQKLKQFSFIMYLFVVIDFAINYHLIIYLLSSVQINQSADQLPFNQVEPTSLQLILLPMLIFSFVWQNQFLIGCLEYVTIASISKWFAGLIDLQNQSEFDKDHVKIAVSEMVTRMPQLAKASFFILIFTIPKVMADLILDNINNIKNVQMKERLQRLFSWLQVIYQETLRSIELVMYVEISKHDYQVNEARDKLKENLKDPKVQEEFEKYGNLGSVFNSCGKAFIVIIMFAVSQICFSQINYYYVLLYSPKGITMFCLFLGFSISSLYLSIYGLSGQTLLYLVLLERQQMEEAQTKQFTEKLKRVFPSMYEYIMFTEEEKRRTEQEEKDRLEQEQQNQPVQA